MSAPVRGDLAQQAGVVGLLSIARASIARARERTALTAEHIGEGVQASAALRLGIRLRALAARHPRPVLGRERHDAPPPTHRDRRTALESTASMPVPRRVNESAVRSSSTSALSSR